MSWEKPGGIIWWPLWYTTERAKQLAAEELIKKEEEKLKNKSKWAVKTILSKSKK